MKPPPFSVDSGAEDTAAESEGAIAESERLKNKKAS